MYVENDNFVKKICFMESIYKAKYNTFCKIVMFCASVHFFLTFTYSMVFQHFHKVSYCTVILVTCN